METTSRDDGTRSSRAQEKKACYAGKFKLAGGSEVGHDVNFKLILTNLKTDAKTIPVNITANAILYNRKPMHNLLKDSHTVQLGPTEAKEILFTIPYSQYEDRLPAENMIQVRAVCLCEQTKDYVVVERNILLENPKLKIMVSEPLMVNKESTVEVSFTNPLHKEVTDCVLTAEGSGLIKEVLTMKVGTVKSGETLKIPIKITPNRAGHRHLVVDFTCSKFSNIKACQAIDVASNPNDCLYAAPAPASKK
ncbi:protein-glutamine gamma-glutamyltransferase E-like [Lissotriton helveticus]